VNTGIMMVTALFILQRSLESTSTNEYWGYDGNSFI